VRSREAAAAAAVGVKCRRGSLCERESVKRLRAADEGAVVKEPVWTQKPWWRSRAQV